MVKIMQEDNDSNLKEIFVPGLNTVKKVNLSFNPAQ